MKTKKCRFRFYEELNDFLPKAGRSVPVCHIIKSNQSVKDAIEAIGVPHVEVDLILVNGRSVDFSYKLNDEDNVSVYPVFESLDITPVTRLRAKPLRNLRFLLDVHLGKLARYMRLCGFDVFYDPAFADDNDIIALSLDEKRVVITRDTGLLKNGKVTRGYWLRSSRPDDQLKEILSRFDLFGRIALFTRCMECNSVLEKVDKEMIEAKLMPGTRKYFNEFYLCRGCDRIYWKGSHYNRMKEFIFNLTGGIVKA